MPDPYTFLKSLSQQHKLQDQMHAQSQEAYRWSRQQKGYDPPMSSADSAAYGAADRMHRRVRDQVRNDGTIKGAVRTLANRVVGQGIQTFADPVTQSLRLPERDELLTLLDQGLESDDCFRDWWEDHTQFDVHGRHAGPDMERIGFNEQATVGDTIFIRCKMSGPNRKVPICRQSIEREQLDVTKDRERRGDQNAIRNGIEFDRRDRAVAYHVYDAHPGDAFSPFQAHGKSKPIPADRVIHVSLFQRPSQTIGVSWFDAIGQDCFDEDKLVTAELQSAAKAARMAFYVKTNNPVANGGGLDFGDGVGDGCVDGRELPKFRQYNQSVSSGTE